LTFIAAVFGGTAAISLAAGALGHKNLLRSLATGYYVVGAAVLVGCFVVGSRGWRTETQEGGESPLRPRFTRRRRRATPRERAEGRRTSVGLFVLGIALVLLGSAVDPSRRAF
jgi:hypothetical protein